MRAVQAFRERQLRDSKKAKNASERKLERLIAKHGLVFHTKPRRAQKVCMLLGWKHPSYLFLLGMGAGKALADSEPVLMADGRWRRITDVRVGDAVMGRDGRAHRVLGVFPQGKKDIFKVSFSSGAWSLCSADHYWSVHSAKGRERVLTTSEIVEDGLVDRAGNARHYTPVLPPLVYTKTAKTLPIDPYALGVLIGDGALGGSNCSVTLGPTKQGVLQRLQGVLRLVQYNKLTWGVLGCRRALAGLGLRCKSRDKRLPAMYLRHPDPSVREAVMYGMLDTDGSDERGLAWSTASAGLACDFEELVRSVGGLTRRRKAKTVDGWAYHQMTVQLPVGRPRFMERAYVAGARKYGPTNAIRSIEPKGRASCTCIAVEGGHFVTRGHTVTHNSKLSLDLYANRRRAGQVKRALVLVPNVVNLGAWEQEVQKHAPRYRVRSVDAAGAEARWRIMEGRDHVVVCTYQGLAALVCGLKPDEKKQRRVMKLDKKLLKRVTDRFDLLVLDEITSIKNHDSVWFKCIKAMRKNIKYCYGLTGTPFDKEPSDLWSQFFVIDNGYTLGETLGLYRAAYFTSKYGYFGGIEHTFMRSKKGELARRLRNISVRYSEAECQDLPPAIGGLSGELMLVPVKLPIEQSKYYASAHNDLALAKKNDLATVKAAYTRCRMIASGWLGAKTDEGESVEITFKTNPKFDAVSDLLQKIPANEKVIIVCWFNATCRMLMARLKAEKHSAVLINGTTTAKAKRLAMASFCDMRSGPRVLVASTAISKGVNLQGAAKYMIFVESPDSSIERRQMEARIRREGGIKGTRYYYDVVVAGSVDEKILKSIVEGKKLHDVLVDRA